MQREDVLLDENNDLLEEGNEWAEGESIDTDVELITLCDKGENTEFPYAGVGIHRWLKKREDRTALKRELDVQLEDDGITNAKIDLSEGIKNLKIEIYE